VRERHRRHELARVDRAEAAREAGFGAVLAVPASTAVAARSSASIPPASVRIPLDNTGLQIQIGYCP
jgi:hypothetical protein